jgi:hypothetical protein
LNHACFIRAVGILDFKPRASIVEMDVDAPVVFAFVFDLADANGADF